MDEINTILIVMVPFHSDAINRTDVSDLTWLSHSSRCYCGN